MTTVAFLGLGQMGARMANALVRGGFEVRGWTRSNVLPDSLTAHFEMRSDLENAVDGADIVIVCVSDDKAVDALITGSGMANWLRPGTVVIDMGTSGPLIAKKHAAALAGHGVLYLDAPVSGGVQGAEAGTLTIFAGGTAQAYDRAVPVLSAMGTPHYLGPAGAGQSAKLANQVIAAVTIAAVAEGLAFAEKQGIDGSALLKALEGGFADSRILRLHGPRMASRDYAAPGLIRLHLKDLRLADAAVRDFSRLPHVAKVKQVFEKLAGRGLDHLDHSAYATEYQDDAPGVC